MNGYYLIFPLVVNCNVHFSRTSEKKIENVLPPLVALSAELFVLRPRLNLVALVMSKGSFF